MSQEMEQARQILLMLKGALSECTPEEQAEAQQVMAEIKAIKVAHPTVYGIAVAIVGAEMAAES